MRECNGKFHQKSIVLNSKPSAIEWNKNQMIFHKNTRFSYKSKWNPQFENPFVYCVVRTRCSWFAHECEASTRRRRAEDAEAMDYRCPVDSYANTSRRRVEPPGDKTAATHRKGVVCAELSASLTVIRESPIAPAQYILLLFFIICTWECPYSISANFCMQCA